MQPGKERRARTGWGAWGYATRGHGETRVAPRTWLFPGDPSSRSAPEKVEKVGRGWTRAGQALSCVPRKKKLSGAKVVLLPLPKRPWKGHCLDLSRFFFPREQLSTSFSLRWLQKSIPMAAKRDREGHGHSRTSTAEEGSHLRDGQMS